MTAKVAYSGPDLKRLLKLIQDSGIRFDELEVVIETGNVLLRRGNAPDEPAEETADAAFSDWMKKRGK